MCGGVGLSSKSSSDGRALAVNAAPMTPGAASPPRRNERRVERYDLIRWRMIFSWWQYCVRLSAAPLEHVVVVYMSKTARRTDIIFVAGIITAPLVQHRATTLCAATDCDKITLLGLNSPLDVKQLTQNAQMTKKSIYNL